LKLFTIGYGGRDPEEFLATLVAHGVRAVVDVRLRPERANPGIYARAAGEGKGIEGLLARGGIAYFPLVELGNVFLECDDWEERFGEYFRRVGDLLTARLGGVPEPFCLLCSERDARKCHRRVVAEHLAAKGYEVHHLA
jgi:uncharacterized protein (DUF488 family)